MLILKYFKIGTARFVPHVDMLRLITRVLRRMDCKVEYSEGFNPHMLLHMSPPCPVNVESLCEYVEIDTEEAFTENFLTRFNAAAPAGITAVGGYNTGKAVNFAARAAAARYEITGVIANGHEKDIESFKTEKLHSVLWQEGKLVATLSCGNENLRADKFLAAINEKYPDIKLSGARIVKTNLYFLEAPGTFCDADALGR